jgi:putative tricarboxylic transport membrane protein
MIGVNTRSQMIALNTELKGQFKLDDFEFLAQMQGDPYVLAVKSDSGMETLDDFVEAAKSKGRFTIGGFGANSAHSLYVDNLTEQLGIQPQYIPYEGGSEAVTALLGGNVDAALTNAGQVIGQVEAGDLRVLGISTPERIEQLPDAPTFEEQGLDESLTVTHWRGFYAKADTPPETVDCLGEAFEKLSQQPEWQEYLDSSGLTNDYVGPDQEPMVVREDFEDVAARINQQG